MDTRYRTQVSSSSSSSSNWTQSHLDRLDRDYWIEDHPFRPLEQDPVVNNFVEDNQLEDPLVDNLNRLNLDMENQGASRREPPPPYSGPGNPQQNGQVGAAQLLNLVQNLITAQQNQHQAQVEADNRFQQAHRELGVQIENLTQAIGAGGGRQQHGGAQSFKPSMFRALDMKATNKENKLLSEEFMNWQLSIGRVLQANPNLAALPIQRLTALILAGIGEKAERRLTGLGQNPTFNSLDEFFDRLKSIFCSSTVQTDAEEQFHKARQYTSEDLNSWHARCLLYFRLAFPTQEYWNLVLKKFFEGMSNKKLAQKTVELYIVTRPGGWEALCNMNGYDHILTLTLKCQAQEAFISHLFSDSKTSQRIPQDAPVPMDTSAVQPNRNFPRNRNHRNSTANVNPNQDTKPGQSANSTPPSNPPGGMQKRLNRMARSQGGQPKTVHPPSTARDKTKPWSLNQRDKSQDICNRCNNPGHWAKECTQVRGQKRTWADVANPSVGTIVSSIPASTSAGEPSQNTNPN